MMASPYSDIGSIIYFAICWNSLVLLCTLNSENHISYTKSADNLFLYSGASSQARKLASSYFNDNKQSVLETTRETSFNFSAFQAQAIITIHYLKIKILSQMND